MVIAYSTPPNNPPKSAQIRPKNPPNRSGLFLRSLRSLRVRLVIATQPNSHANAADVSRGGVFLGVAAALSLLARYAPRLVRVAFVRFCAGALFGSGLGTPLATLGVGTLALVPWCRCRSPFSPSGRLSAVRLSPSLFIGLLSSPSGFAFFGSGSGRVTRSRCSFVPSRSLTRVARSLARPLPRCQTSFRWFSPTRSAYKRQPKSNHRLCTRHNPLAP